MTFRCAQRNFKFGLLHKISCLSPVVLLCLVFVVACNTGNGRLIPDGAREEFDSRSVMNRAVEQLLSLESTSFSLEHLAGTTTLLPGLEMTKAFGLVEMPNKFAITVQAELAVPRTYIEIGIVTIGDTAYMTDMLSGQWRPVSPDNLPFTVSDLGGTLAAVVDAIQSPELVALDEIRGFETYRIRGDIKSQDLALLVPGAGTGFDVGLELWLHRTNGLLQQAFITGKVVPTDLAEAVRRLTLTEINVPVNIKAPG